MKFFDQGFFERLRAGMGMGGAEVAEALAPMISVVIPAHNEERFIEETVAVVTASFESANPHDFEIIVADDDSTDETARLAEKAGARVVRSGKRNIGATRNVGAAAARGKWLLFLDADTLVSAELISELRAVMAVDGGDVVGGEAGAPVPGRDRKSLLAGGGTPVAWREEVPLSVHAAAGFWNRLSRTMKWPAGSFFFARRDLFEKAGGFDERFFVSEEIHLARKLKKFGRLAILKTPVVTSGRKAHAYSPAEFISFAAKALLHPRRTLMNREHLDIWYARREPSHDGKWGVVAEREIIARPPWFQICLQDLRLPDGRIIPDYGKFRLPEFAAVVAETEDGRIIMERNYRHGIEDISLEIPAGVIDKGEKPLAAAKRELLEETGYEAREWKSLGAYTLHGNYGSGAGHLFHATGARKVKEPSAGDLEEIEILLMSPTEVQEALQKGEMKIVTTAAALGLSGVLPSQGCHSTAR